MSKITKKDIEKFTMFAPKDDNGRIYDLTYGIWFTEDEMIRSIEICMEVLNYDSFEDFISGIISGDEHIKDINNAIIISNKMFEEGIISEEIRDKSISNYYDVLEAV